jgi:hypothetical protein
VRICGEYVTSALQWPTRSMKRRSTFIMTESTGPRRVAQVLFSPAVFEPFQNSGEFKCQTRQTHEPHEQTQTHRPALYSTPFVCRPCIPAPPCVFEPVLSGVCVPAPSVVLNGSAFRLPN